MTSVAQVNDTDLHAPLKRLYRALETQDMLEQCRLKGDVVPVADRSDCVAWLCLLWFRTDLHTDAAKGFWKVGLANALDGTEDHRLCREAKVFWEELAMPQRRAEASMDVEEEVRAGRL